MHVYVNKVNILPANQPVSSKHRAVSNVNSRRLTVAGLVSFAAPASPPTHRWLLHSNLRSECSSCDTVSQHTSRTRASVPQDGKPLEATRAKARTQGPWRDPRRHRHGRRRLHRQTPTKKPAEVGGIAVAAAAAVVATSRAAAAAAAASSYF